MYVKAYLNPNPEFQGEILINPHNQEIEMKNSPFLEIELVNFPKDEFEIKLISPFILTTKALINSPSYSVFFMDKKFQNPWINQVKIDITSQSIKSQFNIPINIQQLSGTVYNFDESPTTAYLYATRNRDRGKNIMVKTDSAGNFNLYYSRGRRLRVFVADSTYGQKNLECWIMADDLKQNVQINPHIGDRMELYELKVWHFDGIWNVFFLPAIVDDVFPPILNKQDFQIWFNDMEGDIKSFTFHKVYYKGTKGTFYPAYILSVAVKQTLEEMSLPVLIRALVDVPGSGKGESWFIYYPN